MRKIFIVFSVAVFICTTTGMAQAAPTVTKYKNCTELRKQYPKGVAKTKKAAKAAGAKYSPSVYASNAKMDRDKDGAACEK